MALAVPEPALERCLGHGWLGYLPERWRWNRQALAASFYVGDPFHRLIKVEDKKSRLRNRAALPNPALCIACDVWYLSQRLG